MYTYVTNLSLEIPASKVAEVFADLLERYYHDFLPHLYPELAPGSPIQQLVELLECCGYDALYQEERNVIEIEECNVEKLNFEEDIVLCVLEGVTPAGSFLELYGDDNSQWGIHYDDTHKWTVEGQVVFPNNNESPWTKEAQSIKQETYYVLMHKAFDDLVRTLLQKPDFASAPEYEWPNDCAVTGDVRKVDALPGTPDYAELQEFLLNANSSAPSAWTVLLAELARRDEIPEGAYLIDISW